jgi:hypothetical protein
MHSVAVGACRHETSKIQMALECKIVSKNKHRTKQINRSGGGGLGADEPPSEHKVGVDVRPLVVSGIVAQHHTGVPDEWDGSGAQ